MRTVKDKRYAALAVTAAAVLVVLCAGRFWPKKRAPRAYGNAPAPALRAAPAFPSAGYLPPRGRAARVESPPEEAARPYASLSPSATNYMGCISALRRLPAELSPEQFETLRDAIAVPFDSRMSCSLIEFNGIRNAAAEFLLQQPDFPPDLLLDFAGMHDDPGQDPVWRDYCLQMLMTGWQNLAGRGGEESVEARALAVRKLEGAAAARGNTWPGTALLGLRLVSQSDPTAFPPEKTDRLILGALYDRSASEATRVTALRLAGERRLTEARAMAEELARDAASTPMLRLCAVASLGDLGACRDLLEELAARSDPVLSGAAARALRGIAKREASANTNPN